MKFVLLFMFVCSVAIAQDVKLSEYNWHLTDISRKGFTRQQFFNQIDRKFVKVKDSICSNRALLWAYDFKRNWNVDSAKIFMFYTKTTGEVGLKTWWYHVAPIINENGTLWVVDAGFPGWIKGPQTRDEWLKSFAGSTKCKEIKAGENELIERMYSGRVYPETTSYGSYDCYYRIVPGPFWTPAVVAQNLLGYDEKGNPVRVERDDFNRNELYQACVEAVTSKLGRILGGGKKECKELLGL